MKKVFTYILIIIGIILVGLLTIGWLNPVIEYKAEVKVDVPVDLVYKEYIDQSNMPKWVHNFTSIELQEGENHQIGSKYKMETFARQIDVNSLIVSNL